MARKKAITKAKVRKLEKKFKKLMLAESDDPKAVQEMIDKISKLMIQEINNNQIKNIYEETPVKGCIVSSGADSSEIVQNSFIRSKGKSQLSDEQKGVGM
jgi:hypothetical protein